MPAAVVPIRTRDYRHFRARWRISAFDARSRRLRRSLSAEYGTAGRRSAGGPGQAQLGGAEEIVPDRLVAERGDKGAMRLAIGVSHPWHKRNKTLPPRHFAGHPDPDLRL